MSIRIATSSCSSPIPASWRRSVRLRERVSSCAVRAAAARTGWTPTAPGRAMARRVCSTSSCRNRSTARVCRCCTRPSSSSSSTRRRSFREASVAAPTPRRASNPSTTVQASCNPETPSARPSRSDSPEPRVAVRRTPSSTAIRTTPLTQRCRPPKTSTKQSTEFTTVVGHQTISHGPGGWPSRSSSTARRQPSPRTRASQSRSPPRPTRSAPATTATCTTPSISSAIRPSVGNRWASDCTAGM